MEQKEIQEGNLLIGTFMGKVKHPLLEKVSYINDWEYDKSWSWLMPVVEKIMTHRYPDYYGKRDKSEDDGEYDDCAYIRTFGMRDKDGRYMVRFNASQIFYADTLMEATWLAVVDFITWYNSLSPSNKINTQ